MPSLKELSRKFPPAMWIRHRILGRVIARQQIKQDFQKFRSLRAGNPPHHARFPLLWRDRHLCLDDRTTAHGFDAHYIYHPAWAARIIADIKPPFHVDISSKLDFCTLVSAFVPVRFYDYRPASVSLSNLTSEAADLMSLPFQDDSVPSISCMHVVEHIGLGRYGDPLDPEGDLKAMAELKRVVAFGGSLLFVVPIGKPKIMFNAHRIYAYDQIIDYFAGLTLKQFALIPDDGIAQGLIANASPEFANQQQYGCGCFWFQKEAPLKMP